MRFAKFFISIVAVLFFLYGDAQPKPALPPDYFERFSYTLSKDFTFADGPALAAEANIIAKALALYTDSAMAFYQIPDSTDLYYFKDLAATVSYQLGNYQQAILGIRQCQRLKPAPDYQLPYKLILLAFAEAGLAKGSADSTGFPDLLLQQLNAQFSALQPRFRNDMVNLLKGLFNESSVATNYKNLERSFTQAIEHSAGKMDMYAAAGVLSLYQNWHIRKQFQPLIESALYRISPARVKEMQARIPMRDSIHLSAYVYTDETATEKRPAVVSLSPYPSGSEAIRGNVFATNGYTYVYVDSRGRRESEGVFFPYEDDARDFYDIIDWVSRQPWCNGKVATSGGSYLGFTQWQAVRKAYKHPALKAINPMVAVGFGVDFPRTSNQFYPYILQWALYVSGRELNQALFGDYKFWVQTNYALYKNRLPFSKLDSVAGLPSPVFHKWLQHPDFDDYWKNILPGKADYAALDIPVFSITGYYDADQTGAMYYYNNHMRYGNEAAKKNHYLLIGPYEHGAAQWQPGPIQNGTDLEKEAQVPIYKYVIEWFDWVLKGKEKPAFIKDKITYFETGSHQWKGTPSFETLAKDSVELFLQPAPVTNPKRKLLYTLNNAKPPAAVLPYRHNIAMAIDSATLFAASKSGDDSLYLASPNNLVFESQPLQKDLVLGNKIITRLYMQLNTPDADFDVNIYEITPDGKNSLVATDAIRVRYRNGGDKPQLAKPGELLALNFSGAYIYIKKISRGSKLRLEFESTNSPWTEKNFGFGGVVSNESATTPRWIEAKIYTGGKHASKVVLPIAR